MKTTIVGIMGAALDRCTTRYAFVCLMRTCLIATNDMTKSLCC